MRVLGQIQALLSYDFCPWANRWVAWMKHPLASLGLAVAVATACGVFVNADVLWLAAGLLLISALGTVWPWLNLRGVTCEAEFLSPRCRVGGTVMIRLSVANRWPWPLWGLSIRRGFTEAADESAGLALARIRGWSTMEFEWAFRPSRRGVFPLVTPELDTGFPFGLFHARIPISLRGELIVWPASVPLDSLPDAVELHSREDRLADRRVGDSGDILGTRLFRSGDALRRVHWIQTARFGRLIVTERQASATCAVRLLVDVSSASHQVTADYSTLEHVLSAAASILESLHRHHAFVELQINGERFEVGASNRDLQRCLDAFARVPKLGTDPAKSGCLFDHPSRLLPTISVTTEQGLARHLHHRHRSARERHVLITTGQSSTPEKTPVAGCDCHAWIELPVRQSIKELLPDRWRRGCHAA